MIHNKISLIIDFEFTTGYFESINNRRDTCLTYAWMHLAKSKNISCLYDLVWLVLVILCLLLYLRIYLFEQVYAEVIS